MTVPNAITFLRIALIPLFVLFFYLPFSWSTLAAAIVFVVASVTDWLDGYLARLLDQGTSFGAFLDPVADKLMVVIALVMLVDHFNAWWFTIPAVVIIGREIIISALREWMAELGSRTSVAVSYIGKLKTVLQMVAIAMLIIAMQDETGRLIMLGYVLFLLTAGLTLWSMYVYLRAAWPQLRKKNRVKRQSLS